jgi:putative transposase
MSLTPHDAFWTLTEWARSVRAFRRNRAPIQKKVLAASLCSSGFSYREVAKMVGGMSYIAARDAYNSMITSLPEETKKFRREVAIDGAEVSVSGKKYHVWLARDVDNGEIMAFSGSPTGSAEDGARFLAIVGNLSTNKPLVRLGEGPNLPKGLLNLDLYFQPSQSHGFLEKLGRFFRGPEN